MKHYIYLAAIAMMAACNIAKPKPVPSPTPVDTPCPPRVCPVQTPCPDQTPCPNCPDCPVPTPCPSPPVPPTYPDISHPVGDFEVIAVLAQKDVLGLYISDPNGIYNASVFAMPELNQKIEFEEILTLDVSQNDSDTNLIMSPVTVDIGTTEGSVDKFGLVVSVLCDREFVSLCTATVVSNGNDLTTLEIDTNSPQQSFMWQKK